MDNGEEIPGLNEDWTFAGAKMMEWIAGFVMFMIASELLKLNISKSMPILMAIWFGTTLGMATLRKKFPDEERGIRNAGMVAMGLPPPGIPAPAAIQPVWSGAPLRGYKKETYWEQLKLSEIFPAPKPEEIED